MSVQMLINGRYEVKDTLGKGGMGVVYRAYDSATRRDVALKTMHDSANPVAVEMFSKEWNVLASLSHPNIVDILDCGEFESKGKPRPYFVMPLLPGKTLDQLMHSSSGRLTPGRIIEILRQVCRGLQAAHERGLIHRDLKPSNIFVMEDDAAKIIDFGVVHLTDSHSLTGLKGTVQYMAPEQLDLKPASAQSDIFSLGVVAYEAMTGRKPFARKDEVETAEAVRLHIPPPASEINPAVGDQVSRVIHKAMAKQPWNRFTSAREFGDMLERALRGETVLDTAKIRPRIERAAKAFSAGDIQFATDILNELEAEGNIDTDMKMLRLQIEQSGQQRAIRQLLENARTRLEQEEYPLALQKVQEVLRLDPSNVEAIGMRHEIESQRSEKQIENWLRLAREHLDRGAFSEARQGLQEALKLNRNDTRITTLLNDLARQEQENSKARLQKEQLYEEAKQAFQNGEISTALSKLERVLELNRRLPDRTSPERDALYQTFYNQVRSENDANRIAYEEARRYLAEKDFAKALFLCEENLRKYPGQALFHALKLEVSERERQELYAYSAEMERRLDAEPDLDRKLTIAKEAADRYPQEAHFKQSLKLVRDRRDLVLSIVARTKFYEERGQFAEAMGQWEILRGIYPQYPGLQFELEQVKRRRELQLREEAKARWVEQTDLALRSGDFARARDSALEALEKFPGDAELSSLANLAKEGIERHEEAQRLLSEGRQLCAAGEFDKGLAVFEAASKLDESDNTVRAALTDALIQRAQSLIETDWTAAEPLIQRVLDLDSNSPAAKSLRAQIQDQRRRRYVDSCLAEARELRTRGDYAAALAKIDSGLKTYSGDGRLVGFKAGLERERWEQQQRKQRSEDLEEVRQLSKRAQQVDDASALDRILERTIAISQKYPGDSEFGSLTEALNLRSTEFRTAALNGKPNDSAMAAAAGVDRAGVDQSVEQAVAPRVQRAAPAPVNRAPASSPATPPLAPPPSPAPPVVEKPPARSNQPSTTVGAWKPGSLLKWGSIAAIVIAVIVVAWLTIRHTPNGAGPPVAGTHQQPVPVLLTTTPAAATVHVDGKPVQTSGLKLTPGRHDLEISMPGYRSVSRSLTVTTGMAPLPIALDPELQRLDIFSNFPAGKVLIDGQIVGALDGGKFQKDDLSLAEHTIQVVDGGRQLINVHISSAAARAPQVSPVKDSIVVLGSFGDAGKIYSGAHLELQKTGGGRAQAIPGAGADVATGSDIVLTDGSHQQTYSVESTNYPLLSIYANGDTDSRPQLSISANVSLDDVQISVNGKRVPWREYKDKIRGRLDPGTYTIQLSKPGYEDATAEVVLAQGDKKQLPMELKPKPLYSWLVIQHGEPHARVFIDDVQMGQLDDSGAITIGEISPGEHKIGLRKNGYEAKEFSRMFNGAQRLNISEGDATLVAFGGLEFRISPAGCQIRYRRLDEAQFRTAENNQTVRLQRGTYVVVLSADGFETKELRYDVDSGKPVLIELTLASTQVAPPVPHKSDAGLSLAADPGRWYTPPGWIQYHGQSWGWMRVSKGSFTVLLRPKAPNFLGAGGVIEFVVGYSDGGRNKILYRIGKDGWLTRKVTLGGVTQDSNNTIRLKGEDFYRLVITIEPARVLLRDGAGKVLDDCEISGFDPTAGHFGFKNGIFLNILRSE